jgi:hypothetical protein
VFDADFTGDGRAPGVTVEVDGLRQLGSVQFHELPRVLPVRRRVRVRLLDVPEVAPRLAGAVLPREFHSFRGHRHVQVDVHEAGLTRRRRPQNSDAGLAERHRRPRRGRATDLFHPVGHGLHDNVRHHLGRCSHRQLQLYRRFPDPMEQAVGVGGIHGDLQERIPAAGEGALERGGHIRREGHEGAALVRHEEAVEAFHAAAMAFRGGPIGIGGQPMDRGRFELVAAFGSVEDGGRIPKLDVGGPVGAEAIALSREARIGVPDEQNGTIHGTDLAADLVQHPRDRQHRLGVRAFEDGDHSRPDGGGVATALKELLRFGHRDRRQGLEGVTAEDRDLGPRFARRHDRLEAAVDGGMQCRRNVRSHDDDDVAGSGVGVEGGQGRGEDEKGFHGSVAEEVEEAIDPGSGRARRRGGVHLAGGLGLDAGALLAGGLGADEVVGPRGVHEGTTLGDELVAQGRQFVEGVLFPRQFLIGPLLYDDDYFSR